MSDDYQRYYSEVIQPKLDEMFEIKISYIKQIEVEFWDRYRIKHRNVKLNTYYYYDYSSNDDMLGIQYLGGVWFFSRQDYYNLLYGSDEREYEAFYFHIDGESKPGNVKFSRWHNSFKIEKIDGVVVFFEPTGNGVTSFQYEWLLSMKILDNFVR